MPSYCTDIYGKFNVSAAFPKIWFSISERGMIIQITLVECNWGTDLDRYSSHSLQHMRGEWR